MIYVLKIRKKKKFRKDLENLIRQKKDISKLDRVVEDLQNAKKLSPEKKDEKMKSMKGHRECHIEPDWLLIYQKTEIEIILVRTGSHSSLDMMKGKKKR